MRHRASTSPPGPSYAAPMTCRNGLLVVAACMLGSLPAQGPPANGPRPIDARWYALQHAKVLVRPGETLPRATVVVRDGTITAVGEAPPPAGATVIDCSGLVLHAGFLEPWFASDVPALDPNTTDQHWNPMVQAQRSALDGDLVPAAERRTLRELGFTAVGVAPSGGVLKGTAAVVQLDEPTAIAPVRRLRDVAYAVASLQTSRDGYPGSEMGAIALLRQLLHDGLWYERCQRAVAADPALAAMAPQPSGVLAAIAAQQALPLWLDTQDELQALRLLAVTREFARQPVVLGSGMEFRRLSALAAAKVPFVLPLHLPDAPDVRTAAAAERVSLRQLQSWEQAPTNSKRLLDAGAVVAWTTARLRDRKDFPARVRDAIACGVTPDQALAALTTVPAQLLGVEARLGTVAVGKLANLVVGRGDPFTAEREVRFVLVGGDRHVVKPVPDRGLDGTWSWRDGLPGAAGRTATVTIAGDSLQLRLGDVEAKASAVRRDATTLQCQLAGKELGADGRTWLRLHLDGDTIAGVATAATGQANDVRMQRATPEASTGATNQPPASADQTTQLQPPALVPLPTPLGGYGFLRQPEPAEFAIVGATLWTCDGRGMLRSGAIYVRGGRIVFAGPRGDLPPLPAGIPVLDGAGKHVTPGLIDCHSHTGIARGVNEGGQAVTAEVRIEDVLDPDDISWYRQLAGGVTTVNQLHGSANAIGGQSMTTKNRWGVLQPNDMHFAGAPAGIKWALGENPRRANGSGDNPRYPNTRMGVEALLRDRLGAAADHARRHRDYEALPATRRAKVLPPRLDLELQAIAEIVAGSRRVHCHSYRQDEIFMLCGLAKEHGFKIGTFQHVLEGYKVAEAIASNAIGASSFSDWWGYKFEVYDAIPDNGAILHEVGALVSFNSDSDEHARRLNTEAGKAVKYGGLAPWDALHFVTRNPAIQLGIFDRTGSLTAGKDADVVLWSDHPLGYAARCEATWVDGRPLFSIEADRQARAAIASERQRLLQLALAGAGKRTARDRDPKDAYWAAEDLNDAYCCRDHQGAR